MKHTRLVRIAAALLAGLMVVGALTACTGPQGEQGIQGEKGEKGDPGEAGQPGTNGSTGATGAQGEKGEKGDKGDTGAQGPQGNKGDKGDPGAAGTNGVDGVNGTDGREVMFRENNGWMQWKYDTDTEWINLYEITALPPTEGHAKITLDTKGGMLPEGALSEIEVTPGTTVYLPTPTSAGYKFMGWYLEDGTGPLPTPFPIRQSDNLYAEWKAVAVKTLIDPFDGIEYIVSGISPGCTIAINTQNCSDDAQRYVDYSTDKEHYANGDTVTITATIWDYDGYELTHTADTFIVEGQSEYFHQIEQEEYHFIKQEMDDRMQSIISKSLNTDDVNGIDIVYDLNNELDYGRWIDECKITSITAKLEKSYISVLKNKYRDEYYDQNIISFVYSVDVTSKIKCDVGTYNPTNRIYVTVSVGNVIHYADGTIDWNSGFSDQNVIESLDISIATTVMVNMEQYNITEISALQ